MASPLVTGTPDDVYAVKSEHPFWGKLDFIPVVEGTSIIGVCETPSDPSKTLGEGMTPLRSDMLLSADADVLSLFNADWHESRYFLVVDGTQVVGMITPSDLNKVAVFGALFDQIATYEERLTAFLEQRHSPERWWGYLLPDQREAATRNYNKLRERDMEIDFLRVLPFGLKHMVLRNIYGPPPGIDSRPITELRNRVSHAMPFIQSVEDIRFVSSALEAIDGMIRYLDELKDRDDGRKND